MRKIYLHANVSPCARHMSSSDSQEKLSKHTPYRWKSHCQLQAQRDHSLDCAD